MNNLPAPSKCRSCGASIYWLRTELTFGAKAKLLSYIPAPDRINDYSDKLTISWFGNIGKIECWDSADGPSKDELLAKLTEFDDWRLVDVEKLKRIWDILTEG